MTVDDLTKFFEENDDAYCKFDEVTEPLCHRADMYAFMILHRLVPDDQGMVAGAEHDKIWLQPRPEEVAAAATEDDLLDLIRCGVRYDGHYESFYMFA